MKIRTEIYTQNKDYTVRIEEADGNVFGHLDVVNWSPSVFRRLKIELKNLLLYHRNKGHDMLFVYTSENKAIKFCGMLRPFDEVRKLGNYGEGHIGAWDLEEL